MYGTGLLEYQGPVPTLMSEYNTMIDFSQARSILSIPMDMQPHKENITAWSYESPSPYLFLLAPCQWNAAPCYTASQAIGIKWTKWLYWIVSNVRGQLHEKDFCSDFCIEGLLVSSCWRAWMGLRKSDHSSFYVMICNSGILKSVSIKFPTSTYCQVRSKIRF